MRDYDALARPAVFTVSGQCEAKLSPKPKLNNELDFLHNSSNLMPQRRPFWLQKILFKRRLIILATTAIVFFLTGLSIPYILSPVQSPISQFPSLPKSPRSIRPTSTTSMNSLLNDVFITVKTTNKYHYPRLVILLETWVSLVRSHTWFFTDTEDAEMSRRTHDHLVVTNCSASHARAALVCKMAAEYDAFIKSGRSWWCHFDDDNYVHVHQLSRLLASYDSSRPWYLGKPSTAKPLEIFDIKAPQNTSSFWFATGGAGLCVSRAMALRIMPFAADGRFAATGDQFWFPDDVTLGYIIEHLLGERLTVVNAFHSHLEPMGRISFAEISSQITFSYINYNGVSNALNIPGPFDLDADPTRFYSLHCLLYGWQASFCPDGQRGAQLPYNKPSQK